MGESVVDACAEHGARAHQTRDRQARGHHERPGTGRGAGSPSRRAVLAGAAWAAPVVVATAAAPAYAVSACAAVTYRSALGLASFGTDSTGSRAEGALVSGAGGAGTLGFTATSTMFGGMTRGNGSTNENLRLSGGAVGGTGQPGLALHQYLPPQSGGGYPATAGTFAARQEMVLSFARPVTGLSFTVTDIDSTARDFWDMVAFATAPSSYSRAPSVVGSGTPGDPFHYETLLPQDLSIESSAGNITVTFARTLSSLRFYYWSAEKDYAANNDQWIFITDLSASAAGC